MSNATTMKDIASEANVSVAVVSKALSGYPHVSETTRKRVRAVSEQLNYRPRPRKRMANENGTWRRLALILMESIQSQDLTRQVMKSLTEATEARKLRLELGYIDQQSSDGWDNDLVRQMKHLDGVLLFGCVKPAVFEAIERLGMPVVLMGDIDTSDHHLPVAVHQVNTDKLAMAQCATQMLIDAGHQRIGFFCAAYPEGGWNDHWISGYRLALLRAGLEDDPAIRPVLNPCDRDDTGIEAAGYFAQIDDLPTAYVVPTVRGAACFRMEMARRGVELEPKQIVMGGRREDAAVYGLRGYPMVSEDVVALSTRAVELIARLIDDNTLPPAQVVVPFGIDGF